MMAAKETRASSKEHASKEAPEQESEWLENLVAILVVTLAIVLIYGWFHGWFSSPAAPAEEIQRFQVPPGDDPALGNRSAPVTIIEFSDYLCSACKDFHDHTWPRLKTAYIDTGKARFVYRDYPMESLHPQTYKASATATCAGEQGAYWAFHDAFYEHQANISEELVSRLVQEHNLSQEALDACRAQQWPYQEAKADYEEGKRLGGVSGTPTFFINGRRVVGNKPYEEFAAIIDEELARATGQ